MFNFIWRLRFPAFYKLLGILVQGFNTVRRYYNYFISMCPGSMLVKCSIALVALLVLFEGPNSVLVATMSAVGEVLPMRIDFDKDWFHPTVRMKRSFKMHLTDKDVNHAKSFAVGIVNRLARHEQNLVWGKVVPQIGSPSYTAMIASWADDRAMDIAKEGYINAKASAYVVNKNCARYGLSSTYCAEQLMRMSKTCPGRIDCNMAFRSFSGSCNNKIDGMLGSTYSPYARILPPAYEDGIWQARGGMKRLPSPIVIAKALQEKEYIGTETTVAVVAWGNLITNDMSHTVSNRMMNTGGNIMCCSELGNNLAPRYRHPLCMPLQDANNKCVNYVRSMLSDYNKCVLGPAQQMNAVTHFLDMSGVYGSTREIFLGLRSFTGGKLKVDLTGRRPTLPKTKNLKWHHNSSFYLSGEVRINMDAIGTALHTLLVREHNRIATLLQLLNPHWDDERLFEESRRISIAQYQHIVYKEWLPLVIGEQEIEKQKALQISSGHSSGLYDEKIDPSVLNSFANGAMKFISSMVDDQIRLYDEERNLVESILSREAILHPDLFSKDRFFDSVIRGLTTQSSQASDLSYSDAVAKFLYSTGNSSGMNAFSMDIQRGRDHGLPPYTEFRKLFGLSYESFDKLEDSISRKILNKLEGVYNKVDDIDLLVGGMAEKPNEGALVGQVFTNLISTQFVLSRLGDRYFYDNKDQLKPFNQAQIAEIKKVSLARLLCDNGDSIRKMQRKAFLKPDSESNKLLVCTDLNSIPEVNLKMWQEKNVKG